MIEIGKMINIKAIRKSENGMYLDGGESGEILLPNRYVPEGFDVYDEIEVFIYHDHEKRLTATTIVPKIQVGEYAYLKVVSVSKIGAFMNWGLQKDLFVPYAEQNVDFNEGESHLIYAFIDEMTGRITGSSKINKYLEMTPKDFLAGNEVEILICNKTDIGYNVIVNNRCWGLIHKTDVLTDIKTGLKMKAYVKDVREGSKIDISIQKPGFKYVYELTDMILDKIKENSGSLTITDKSSPEEIFAMFKVSKKVYKKSIGALYKQRLIKFSDGKILSTIDNA
ncbi:MAG: GntR family transcriptional regulator [Candidatus Delongbacteria bacterium]|nr:GntR family transcriptional regulator [Candidatus Delongbacteria bacterium]